MEKETWAHTQRRLSHLGQAVAPKSLSVRFLERFSVSQCTYVILGVVFNFQQLLQVPSMNYRWQGFRI